MGRESVATSTLGDGGRHSGATLREASLVVLPSFREGLRIVTSEPIAEDARVRLEPDLSTSNPLRKPKRHFVDRDRASRHVPRRPQRGIGGFPPEQVGRISSDGRAVQIGPLT